MPASSNEVTSTTRRPGTLGVSDALWAELGAGGSLDDTLRYLRFREHLEPGAPLLITTARRGRIVGALHGALATPATAMFSHPWKLLTSDQMLRVDLDDGNEASRQRRALVRALCQDWGGENWQALATALGEPYVVRGFDVSRPVTGLETGDDERAGIMSVLLRDAQQAVREGRAAAVVLPYVDPADAVLVEVLRDEGFRGGVLTAAAALDLATFDSYDSYVGALSTRIRRRYRYEERGLERDGCAMTTLSLDRDLDRVVDLEIQTRRRYGEQPNRATLAAARRVLAETMTGSVRIPAVERQGSLVACALHLTDDRSCSVLSYGCDYTIDDRSTAYPNTCIYEPARFAVQAGLERVRLGFEAFFAKTLRGANLYPRGMYVWAPETNHLAVLGDLLQLVGSRTGKYLRSYSKHVVMPDATAIR